MYSLTRTSVVGLYLALGITSVFGELAVLRPDPSGKSINMTCISDDDGGALVWNDELGCGNSCKGRIDSTVTEFQTLPFSPRHPIDCPLNASDGCTSKWVIKNSDWQIARSIDKAMGPVLDKRWEDFDEISQKRWNQQNVTEVNEKGAVVFSVRGQSRVVLSLRSTQDPKDNVCTRIQIPEEGKVINSPVESTVWRTFVLKWDGPNKIAYVFNQTGSSIKYSLKGLQQLNHLYVEVPGDVLFRFHFYNYLYATKAGVRLLSPEWNYERSASFCVEMSVGLCRECQLEINAIDKAGNRLNMTTVDRVEKSPAEHDLPTWQFVKLNTNLHFGLQSPFRLEMITTDRNNTQNPLWAVASVRECSGAVPSSNPAITSPEAVRRSKITVTGSPLLACQRLSYNGSSVVVPPFVNESSSANDLPLCPEGKVGPRCTTSCNEIVGNDDCKGLSTCRDTSCVCSQGFGGLDCTQHVDNHQIVQRIELYGLGGKINIEVFIQKQEISGKVPLRTYRVESEISSKRTTDEIVVVAAPDAPKNVTARSLGEGIIKLTWSYPQQGCVPRNFSVKTTAVSTDLRESESVQSSIRNYTVIFERCRKEYSAQRNLLPSTVYELCISVVSEGKKGRCRTTKHSTQAALAFKHGSFEEVDRTNSTIVIHLPSVSNDTRDSTMHVIVKGLIPCEPHSELDANLRKHADVSDGQLAWRAASFSNERKETFTIGDNATHGGAWNCALKPGETYEIVIVVQGGAKETENQTIAISLPPIRLYAKPKKFNLVWLVIPAVFVISALLIFIGYRKREVISKCFSNPVQQNTVQQNTVTPKSGEYSSNGEYYETNDLYNVYS